MIIAGGNDIHHASAQGSSDDFCLAISIFRGFPQGFILVYLRVAYGEIYGINAVGSRFHSGVHDASCFGKLAYHDFHGVGAAVFLRLRIALAVIGLLGIDIIILGLNL